MQLETKPTFFSLLVSTVHSPLFLRNFAEIKRFVLIFVGVGDGLGGGEKFPLFFWHRFPQRYKPERSPLRHLLMKPR